MPLLCHLVFSFGQLRSLFSCLVFQFDQHTPLLFSCLVFSIGQHTSLFSRLVFQFDQHTSLFSRRVFQFDQHMSLFSYLVFPSGQAKPGHQLGQAGHYCLAVSCSRLVCTRHCLAVCVLIWSGRLDLARPGRQFGRAGALLFRCCKVSPYGRLMFSLRRWGRVNPLTSQLSDWLAAVKTTFAVLQGQPVWVPDVLTTSVGPGQPVNLTAE